MGKLSIKECGKRTICIVSAGVLPVPDTKGGAVERLIQMIVETNEIAQQFNIIVITCPDKEAIIKQKLYSHTKFVNLKSYDGAFASRLNSKIKWHIQHWFGKDCFFIDYLTSPVNRFLVKNRNKFDFIIGECAGTSFCNTTARLIGKNKLAIHLHANVFASKILEKTYGNIITVSTFIMRQYYSRGTSLPKERIKTVFNGINTEIFTNKRITIEERNNLRKRLNLAKDDFVLIFCGRIVPDKGVKELITALEKIENPKVKLVIMGSSNFGLGDYGSYPQETKSMVDRNKGRIVFTGFINNNELYKYHQIANVGVVPSMHNDPCPLSLFELITSGLPTIATKAGGMPEIGNNDTTIFVEMDNIVDDLIKAINMLYNDEQLRISMSKAAIKRAMLFKQKRFYDDFCSIVNGFIDLNEKSDD